MSKEEFALGSFLSAMHESNLDGRAMRAAMLKALGMDGAAIAQPEPHPDDIAVDAMAAAMKEKLRLARKKGRAGWETCSQQDLSRLLREHVDKGDPRDVANFCAFLHALGFGIAQPEPVEPASMDLIARGLAHSFWGDLGDCKTTEELLAGLFVRVYDDGEGTPIKEVLADIANSLAAAKGGV